MLDQLVLCVELTPLNHLRCVFMLAIIVVVLVILVVLIVLVVNVVIVIITFATSLIVCFRSRVESELKNGVIEKSSNKS